MAKAMFLLGQLGFRIFLSQELIQREISMFEITNSSITWPTFFTDAFRDIRGPIWIPFFPALAITYFILTFNILAHGIQIAVNRKGKGF